MLYKRLPVLIFVMAMAVAFSSCKENIVISSKISTVNTVGVYDTSLTLITHTYYDDTALTSSDINGLTVGVGTITDPFFGVMTASAYFQVIPWDLDTGFFTENTVDSAQLVLPYSGFTYGDSTNTSVTQTYQVFYMSDTMSYNTTYFSYNTKAINAEFPLSEPYTANVYSLTDSFGINTLPVNYPGLRIPLKLNDLIPKLQAALYQTANSGNPFQLFIANFNGICVKVADTRQSNVALPYFYLGGDNSTFWSNAGIVLYFHTAGTTTAATGDTDQVTNFYFSNAWCAQFNSISKSYSHYPVNNLFHSTQANDSIIALQNQPGASIDIKIPGISHLPKGIINKAEIQLPILPGNYNPSIYQPPITLFPTGVSNGVYPNSSIAAGLTYVVADYYPLSSTSPLVVLDGYEHLMTTGPYAGNYVYTIDIPREVMASIQAKNDTLHLQINGTQQYYGAFHFVGGGGGYSNPAYRPRLYVVYSKLTN